MRRDMRNGRPVHDFANRTGNKEDGQVVKEQRKKSDLNLARRSSLFERRIGHRCGQADAWPEIELTDVFLSDRKKQEGAPVGSTE